jgi:hypothetical protein
MVRKIGNLFKPEKDKIKKSKKKHLNLCCNFRFNCLTNQ